MRKLLQLCALLFLFAIISSCQDDNSDMEPETSVEGLTQSITDLVPNEILSEIQSLGFPIYGGANPPSIEETYRATPFTLLNSSITTDTPGTIFPDYRVTFSSQDNDDLTVMVDYVNGDESGAGLGGFVVGEDCNFTVFVEVTTMALGETAKLAHLISGTLVSDGIEGLFFANFMIDNFGNPFDLWIENGEGRVFVDRDLHSERLQDTEFYIGLPDCPCEYENDIDGELEMCGEWKDCGEYGDDEILHFGAFREIRWAPDVSGGPGQQCTYDANGKLITGGIAAGSPDKVSPRICGALDLDLSISNVCGHVQEDVIPFGDLGIVALCLGDASDVVPCSQYLSEWPANSGENCGDNVISGIDHLSSLLGNMDCFHVANLFAMIDESANASADLKQYIKGNSTASPSDLEGELMTVFTEYDCINNASKTNCTALQQAIDNL